MIDDVIRGSGGFTKRFWSLISVPVLDDEGRCRHLLQRVEDITDYVRQQAMSDHPSGPALLAVGSQLLPVV